MSNRWIIHRLRPLLGATLLMALAACGGGGGGGAETPQFSITADRSSIQLSYLEGQAPASVHMYATGHGTPPSTLYIGATESGSGINPMIPIAITGMQADITLTATSGLAAGTYTGQVNLVASTDPGGAHPVGGTPLHIAYTVTVTPALKVIPASLGLNAVGGQTATGNLSVQLPVGATTFSSRITSDSPWLSLGTPTGTTVPVTAGPTRSGTYTANVEITSAGQVFNVPVVYSVSVPPGGEQDLASTPTSLTFASNENLVPATQSLAVTLPSWAQGAALQSTVDFHAGPTGWLSLTRTATGLDVVASATTLPAGTYTAAVNLSAAGSTLSIPVSFSVGPGLVATPTSLTFQAYEHADALGQTLTYTTQDWPSGNDIQIAVDYAGGASGWLTPTRTASGLNVAASAASLAQGAYTATLVLTPPSPGTILRIPVSLSVGFALLQPSSRAFVADSEATVATLSGSDPIQLAGGPTATWTATSATPWIHLTRATGDTGSALTYTVDLAALAALPNFSDQAGAITVSVPSTPITPVTFNVTLHKALPEVRSMGPDLLVTGRPTTLTLRGKGFSALPDPTTRLSTPGLSPSNVHVLSDDEVTLQVTPGAATTLPVAYTNALGLDPVSATLRVIAPQTYGYAAIPTGGNKRAIVFDAQRQAVYAPNVDGETLVRFKYQDPTWTVDAVPIPSILDAGMAPGGTSILVTATPGRLRLLNPDDLSTQFTLDHPAGFPRNFTYQSEGIAPMNDGRSWLPTGSGWGELAYFDHWTRTIQPRTPQPDLQTSFYGGPWMASSRDGSRMIVVQSASVTPGPPMLFMDAFDDLLQVSAVQPTFATWMKLSDDGNRFLMDFTTVRDRNWALIGNLTLPDATYFPVAQALSPDGRRAYLLAYKASAMGSWPTTEVPRVFVFDSSTMSAVSTDLPVLGQFDIADYPTCRTTDCDYRPKSTISPDGATLFFLGSVNLVVVPIPVGLR
ncbi:MAG TPA: hypothetical protein VJ623_00485 [Holophagaceae bacterium]|nr:hypothetical protein [Holophagaceae bacterium]